MERTYNFFVLRYSPDPERGEQVNIGIVVDRAPLDIRLTRDLRKATLLDPRRGTGDLLRLEEQIRAWTSRTKEFADVQKSLQHFGPILASDLGYFKATPEKYGHIVDELIRELVAPRARPRAKLSSRLNTAIRATFQKQHLLSSDPADIRRHKVVPNYPVSERENLFVDFALKNGAFHLTETVDFRVREELVRSAKFNEVGLKALIAVRSKKVFRRAKVYFVYAAAAHQEHAITSHLSLMESCSHGLYNFLSRDDRAAYFDLAIQSVQNDVLPLTRGVAVDGALTLASRKTLVHHKQKLRLEDQRRGGGRDDSE